MVKVNLESVELKNSFYSYLRKLWNQEGIPKRVGGSVRKEKKWLCKGWIDIPGQINLWVGELDRTVPSSPQKSCFSLEMKSWTALSWELASRKLCSTRPRLEARGRTVDVIAQFVDGRYRVPSEEFRFRWVDVNRFSCFLRKINSAWYS